MKKGILLLMALLCGTKAAWVNQADKIIAMLEKDREIMLADRIGQPLGEEQKNAGVVVEGLIEGDIALHRMVAISMLRY